MNTTFYSQYAATVPEEWRSRACGIAALKMGLDGLGAQTPDIATLIEEGVHIGAWQEKDQYWRHSHLAILAHNYGVPAYSEEFRSASHEAQERLREYGINKIKKTLELGGCVLVSVPKDMQEGGHFHLVLFTGFGEDGFVYNDPAYELEIEGSGRVATYESFRNLWRGLAIFLG